MTMFSNCYSDARTRFVTAAQNLDAQVESHYIDGINELSIDVAVIGARDLPTLVVSSGLHGVEGFFGSAVQLALMDRLATDGLNGIRYVLLHALNPYGFCYRRRFDQSNIDLNRNFLLADESYVGAPDGYRKLDSFLNPNSPPVSSESYRLKALWTILRHGIPSLKSSIVCGQYEFPKGIFFGGNGLSNAARVVQENCRQWIGQSESVVHIDLHSGLGQFGSYKLLLNETVDSIAYRWYAETYGEQKIEPLSVDGTAYPVKGSMGSWLQNQFQSHHYRFVGAEFGTYGPVRVLGAIRAENRGYQHGYRSQQHRDLVERELVECFCPESKQWRDSVLESSMRIIDTSVEALNSE